MTSNDNKQSFLLSLKQDKSSNQMNRNLDFSCVKARIGCLWNKNRLKIISLEANRTSIEWYSVGLFR